MPAENLQAVPVVHLAGRCLVLALGYFVAGKLGLMLPYLGSHITLIWLPTGIAVAALLRWGMRVWPGIFLGSLAVNMSVASSLGLGVSIAVGNTLGPLLTVFLLYRVRFNRQFDRASDILYLVVAAFIGMLVTASGGVASLYTFDVLQGSLFYSWFTWWAGDFVGVLLASPLLLNVSRDELGKLLRQGTEFTIWLVMACVMGWGVFFINKDASGQSLPLVFLMLPMVVWASMRFEITGSSIGTLVCMLIATLATSRGFGPFHRDESQQGLFVMWVFLATLVMVQLMVTALQTQRRVAEDRIRSLAFFDPLTHLPNRNLLLDRLRQAIATSVRTNRHGALMFLDLDHFKNLNDTYGHDAGDHMLIEVARRLLTCVRQGDTVSRLSGDEFIVVLENLAGDARLAARQAEGVAEKIRQALCDPYRLIFNHNHNNNHNNRSELDYYSSVSIGITLFPDRENKLEELLKRADLTMYQAKSSGRNAIRFFDPAMQAAVDKRSKMESRLRHALERNELKLYYQLQVDQSGCAIGCEALLRWQDADMNMISPAEFIPLAEDTGLILPIGNWVLNQACIQLQAWSLMDETRHLSLAVNVSARQFRESDFVNWIGVLLERYGITPSLLKLELTESVVLYDVEEAAAKMYQLKKLGVSIALDDFGTGFSSLSYLQRLPLDQIKIDQSFVRDLEKDSNDAAIVRTIIALSNTLGLDVIAEGVETQEQYAYLITHGCMAFQGYLFARPEPLDKVDVLLMRKADIGKSDIN